MRFSGAPDKFKMGFKFSYLEFFISSLSNLMKTNLLLQIYYNTNLQTDLLQYKENKHYFIINMTIVSFKLLLLLYTILYKLNFKIHKTFKMEGGAGSFLVPFKKYMRALKYSVGFISKTIKKRLA